MKKILLTISFLALLFTACEPEFSNPIDPGNPNVSPGSADFSKYVAVGNSLSAGYSNGTLYKSGQENSFPKLLADRFAQAGGGEFTQPYLDDDTKDIGGMVFMGQPVLPPKLVIDAGEGKVERINETPTVELTAHPGPYNNMGVPGAKIYHLFAPGYGNIQNVPLGKANPYFVRMASSPSAKVIDDILSQQPTFFTCWIGNNDILSYATSGGSGTDQTGNPDVTTYGPNDITDPGLFAYLYQQLLQGLTSNGAKGAVATLPDVASIPYFTTVPYNPIPLDDNTATALNNAYAQYNAGLQMALGANLISQDEYDKRLIQFSAGQNAPVIADEYLTDLSGLGLPSIRQAKPEDLMVLPSAGVIGQPDPNNPSLIMGISSPLDDQWVLTADEITEIRTATAQMNATIRALAQQYDLAVVDMAAAMEDLIDGIRLEDGSLYTADYFSGFTTLPNLFFSLDGVHPNHAGYTEIANKFIEAINKKYGSTLVKYNPGYTNPGIMILSSN